MVGDRSSYVEQATAEYQYRRGDADVDPHPRQRQAGGADEHITHWIATVQYAFTAPSQDARLRRWNPLGFKVIELNTEPEVPEQAVAGKGG